MSRGRGYDRPSLALHFGRNLRRIRLREGLSQEQLAKRASLHRTEIGRLEKGGRICGIDILMRLAGAMVISPEDLLDGIFWVAKPQAIGSFSFRTTTHGKDITGSGP
jgi:transcriptional regulator with XRE-family HTH domain